MEKRKRCQNFSIEERCRLVELVRSYKDAIINKKTDGASNEAKSSAWVFITSEFNSTATILRSKDSLQKAWVKLKSEGRSHYAKITGIPLSAPVTSDVLLEQVSAVLHESTRALTDCNITSDDILDRVSAILDSANRTSGVTDSYDSSMEMMPLNVKEESTSSNDPLIPEVEVFIQEVDTAETEAAFQFNERFLLTLHDHVHACQYGTFVGNCQKDRRDLRLSERTFSLWGYMASHLNEYKNPLYDPKANADLLRPDLSAQNIRFWRGMYCRHENGVHPREPLADMLPAAVEHCSALQHHINYLAKRITTFKGLLSGRRAERGTDGAVVNYQNGTRTSVDIDTKMDGLQLDNKLIYEGSVSELECANDDHPLKDANALIKPDKIPLITERVGHIVPASLALLEREVSSVALDWKSLKHVTECTCSTPLDHFSRKHHCWGCGRVICTRCVTSRGALPALASPRPAPLCAACEPSDSPPLASPSIITPAN